MGSSNLVSLCNFHHHRHHEGEFEIAGDPAGSLRFLTRAGRVIGSTRALIATSEKASLRALLAETDAVQLTHVTPSTPRAAAGGEPCDLDHTVQVLAHNAALAAARSTGPSP